ncbi:MAG: hypothetical protein A2359_03650 [Candidatus Moranbacteria bacterium RIFOXYB1_FULL_43_19]|nr:MAG: hypothetical protein A2184_02175 [Candidatus Moranbacteria bacterium RIFOXYA1_FULL_44_7]OGI26740.1 MAG: hypothetical protein A2359_03650 [Candidatus Moranbacteria bacterium RIFOXYB1_FULL_43_19]OGI32497.1 MAG: hypothetical protein A2420_02875 [Candidatus Moranbacteria bacterium RIFOXYC1_FULL_44_13]OGI37624.1 MAG: hypothetical protein A2612_04335 [Candidatus Moranbacteria bacterium RIFOXYD1_FULL_44_12]
MPEKNTNVEASAQLLAGALEKWSPEEILASEIPEKRKEEIFLNRYLQKVRKIAGQMAYKLPADVHADDLVGAGLLGLVGAMSKFDPSRQGKFWTYATFRVKMAILNELRYMDAIPRSFRNKMKILGKARSQLTKILGRSPSEDELIEHLGISFEAYHELANIESTGFVNIDELRGYPATQDETMEKVHRNSARVSAPIFLSVLPNQEQIVLKRFYYEDRTMREIAKEMGFTPPRVSQFHAQAILRLKIVNAASEALKKGSVPNLSFLETERKSWMMGLNRAYETDVEKIRELAANNNFQMAAEKFPGEEIDPVELSLRIFLYLEPMEIKFLWLLFVKGYHQSKAVRILNLNLRTAQRWKKGLFQKISPG